MGGEIMNVIPIENWGRDHWSTFAYAETLTVDHKGIIIPDKMKMRTNHETHFFMNNPTDGVEYPTILKNGDVVQGHDDWDCLDDAVKNGLLVDAGTGSNRAFLLTERGRTVADLLRRHKARGGTFQNFSEKTPFDE